MINKKAYVLYVLRTLMEYSDDHNPMTHKDIINHIKEDFGVTMERKAVASCIEVLKGEPFNYEIIKGDDKQSSKGCYFSDRLLDPNDILYINTYLMCARNVPESFATRISKTLLGTVSKYYRAKFPSICYMSKVDRTPNKHLPYVINDIAHALRKNKKISFKYYEYDINGDLIARKKEGKEHVYIVSPHYLYNSLGKFYLLCTKHVNNVKPTTYSVFRVEFIDNVEELNEKATDINKLPDCKNFDIGEYINTHPYPTGDNTIITMELEILKPEDGIRYIKDWYGNAAASIKKVGDKCIAKIKTTEMTAFWWLMQYSTHFNLLGPKSLINKTRDAAKRILDNYK